MPKFIVKAYEEVYYTGEVEAPDSDEAYEVFTEALGDYHPWQTKHNFTILDVRKKPVRKGAKNA